MTNDKKLREFPFDWLKAVNVEDRLNFAEINPNHAFIGPHAAEVAIEAYTALEDDLRFFKYELESRSHLAESTKQDWLEAMGKIKALEKQLQDAIAALKFYSEEAFKLKQVFGGLGDYVAWQNDKGKLARETLAKLGVK